MSNDDIESLVKRGRVSSFRGNGKTSIKQVLFATKICIIKIIIKQLNSTAEKNRKIIKIKKVRY